MRDQPQDRQWFTTGMFALAVVLVSTSVTAQTDPGPRGGAAGAGARVTGLTVKESKFFDSGLDAFTQVASVIGSVAGTEPGLGPRFNMTSCVSCHAHPAFGGTSPAINPQVDPQVNPVPASQITLVTGLGILTATGPVREVRFSTDGGVHDLFTIMGLPGTPGTCSLTQPDFTAASAPPSILRFRIPTPLFGLGLVEAIEDATILANESPLLPKAFGIAGRANRNGNDGTVTRFGWKAQNKSLVIFAGEAYNVEQGITNGLFPDERGENGVPDSASCRRVVTAPQDTVLTQPQKLVDDVNNFADFMRFLAAPVPATAYATVTSAQVSACEAAFNKAGCNVCHIKSMTTGNHATAALRFKTANLFSDLLVHDVGTGDDIAQGRATGVQFRTAPLWGVGQRLFFLHDGRTDDLVDAIHAHAGEAARVIDNFDGLSVVPDAPFNLDGTERQNLIYFLRSL